MEGAPLNGPLPLAKAVELAGEILEALDAAHRKGWCIGMKPANILVSKRGMNPGTHRCGIDSRHGAIHVAGAVVRQGGGCP